MDIKRIKSLFIGNFQNPVRVAVMLLTVLTTTGAWAQTTTSVSTETELKNAITNGANIQLTENIQLSNYLDIDGKTVTLNLNGHTLKRQMAAADAGGQVIAVMNISAFKLNFGDDESTGITTTNYTNSSDAWYTIDGQLLNGKPTQKGIYINNGKKVVISLKP
jgi:hypothetical protein